MAVADDMTGVEGWDDVGDLVLVQGARGIEIGRRGGGGRGGRGHGRRGGFRGRGGWGWGPVDYYDDDELVEVVKLPRTRRLMML
jgi:hypothetical protein